jgi:hypothetical protein
MSEIEQHVDAIIIAYDPPFTLPVTFWENLATELEARLELKVLLLDASQSGAEIEMRAKSILAILVESQTTRACLIAIQRDATGLASIQTARLWKYMETGTGSSLRFYASSPWGAVEWAELIACSRLARTHRWILDVQHCNSFESHDYAWNRSMVSQTIWELRRLGVDCDFSVQEILNANPLPTLILPWDLPRSSNNHFAKSNGVLTSSTASRPVPIESLIPESDWAHIIVGLYLQSFERGTVPLNCRIPSTDAGRNHNSGPGTFSFDRWTDLQSRMNHLLPSEYRGRADETSPTSMGSASLRFDANGQIPWDLIWTSFCDLALAGGPPHRGSLLEAVTRQECEEASEAYQLVVNEIRRGVGLATQLETRESLIPGWVGIVCESEEMSGWLLRAIITENVMVRREGPILYVPAGPEFRIQKEIKNVITSVAKTVHYWRHHRT